MTGKKLSIIVVSVIIPITLFGIYTNSQTSTDIPIIESESQYYIQSIDDYVRSNPIVVLATVESVEVKLVGSSTKEIPIMKEGYEKELEKLKSISDLEVKLEKYQEVLQTYRTENTSVVQESNFRPYQFITLNVDEYIKDSTGKFDDKLVVRTYAEAEGIRQDQHVFYSLEYDIDFPIGEQSLYIISYPMWLEDQVIISNVDDLMLNAYLHKYEFDGNNIQSGHDHDTIENTLQKETFGETTLHSINDLDIRTEWALPKSIEDVRRAVIDE